MSMPLRLVLGALLGVGFNLAVVWLTGRCELPTALLCGLLGGGIANTGEILRVWERR